MNNNFKLENPRELLIKKFSNLIACTTHRQRIKVKDYQAEAPLQPGWNKRKLAN